MQAPLATDLPASKTWRHPNGGGTHYFDSARAAEWIEQFNATGDPYAINALLDHSRPLLVSLFKYPAAPKHVALDELLAATQVKIWKSARLFDAGRGNSFSFIARIANSVMASAITDVWHRCERFAALDEGVESAAAYNPLASTEALAEIVHRVRMVKTPCTDPCELAAQRWLVASFIDCEFHIRRHEASDSMTTVYGIFYTRSRWIYDMTLVAVRRELINDRRLNPIAPASLVRTRSAGLIRYARFLSGEEFTRLAHSFATCRRT
jgi:hypothetical protein